MGANWTPGLSLLIALAAALSDGGSDDNDDEADPSDDRDTQEELQVVAVNSLLVRGVFLDMSTVESNIFGLVGAARFRIVPAMDVMIFLGLALKCTKLNVR